MTPITDKALLEKLEGKKRKTAAQDTQTADNAVTDPELLKQLNAAPAAELPSARTKLGGTESSASKVAGRAALADTALNALSSTWDLAARIPATAYYAIKEGDFNRGYERAAAEVERAAQRDPLIPRPDLVGRTLGLTGTRQYAQAPQRQLGEAVAPVIQETFIAPVAQATGLPEGAVSDIATIAAYPLAGPTGKAVAGTGRAVTGAVKAAPEFTRGVVNTISGRGTRPGERATYAGQYESARQPAGTAYYPDPVLEDWQKGLIPTKDVESQVRYYTPEQQAALRKTGGMVPYEGQTARALGETFAEPYTRLNLTNALIPDALLSLAGYGLGGPLGAAALPAANLVRKGVGLYQAGKTAGAMRQLGDLKFRPLFPQEQAALSQGSKVYAWHPSSVMGLPDTPAAGPIAPAQQAAATQAMNRPGAQPQAAGPIAPAQQAAQQQGITPPSTAVQSGFAGQLQQQTQTPLLTYTPPTLYASETGVVGRTPAQVIDETLRQKYAPQPVTGPAIPSAEPAPAVMPATRAVIEEPQGITAQTELRPQRNLEPTANTQAVAQELESRVAANPQLQGFDRPYVIPQKLQEPINNFLNGVNKHAVAYGPPGTGKTSLAGEWLSRNPSGEIHILDRQTFDKKQATDLANNANISGKPTLFVIDEADQFTPAQITDVLNLMDQTRVNGRMLVTSNNINKVSDKLKTAEFSKIPVETKLNADEKQAFALNVARQFNVDKSVDDILKIANDPALTNFRDVKRAVSQGYSVKEQPRFIVGNMPSEVIKDLNPRVVQYLDDFVNNDTSKNLVIFDKSAFAADPKLTSKLDSWEMPSTTEALQGLPKSLATSPTSSPVFRLVVRDEKDAAALSKLKSLIERSNETKFPTKIVVDHLYEKIDPAIKSRADIITGKDLTAKPVTMSSLATAEPAPKLAEPVSGPVRPAQTQPTTGLTAAEREANRQQLLKTILERDQKKSNQPPGTMSMMAQPETQAVSQAPKFKTDPTKPLGSLRNPLPDQEAVDAYLKPKMFDIIQGKPLDYSFVDAQGITRVLKTPVPGGNLDLTTKITKIPGTVPGQKLEMSGTSPRGKFKSTFDIEDGRVGDVNEMIKQRAFQWELAVFGQDLIPPPKEGGKAVNYKAYSESIDNSGDVRISATKATGDKNVTVEQRLEGKNVILTVNRTDGPTYGWRNGKSRGSVSDQRPYPVNKNHREQLTEQELSQIIEQEFSKGK